MESTNQIDPSLLKYRWMQAYTRLNHRLSDKDNFPTHFASEWPTYFDSMKGRLAAQQDYTLGLASMVGYIAGQYNFPAENIALWKPMQWKGSVPKQVTRNKFIQIYGKPAQRIANLATDDVIDSLMIATYWLRLYDNKRFRWQKDKDRTKKEDVVCR